MNRDLQVHCIGCHNNTEGRLCQFCEPLYYNSYNQNRAHHIKNFQHIWRIPVDCKPCQCHPEGSKSPVCRQEKMGEFEVGSCDCKPGYTGNNCDKCDEKFNMTRPLYIIAPEGDHWVERGIADEQQIINPEYNRISYPYKTWQDFNRKGIYPTNKIFDSESFYEYPICVKASCPIIAGAKKSYSRNGKKNQNPEKIRADKVCTAHGDSGAVCEFGNCKCTENSQPRYHGKVCEYKWEKKDVEEELKAITGATIARNKVFSLILSFMVLVLVVPY